MTKEAREQLLAVRATGQVNMFSVREVQRIAFDNGYYALVDFIETNKKAYCHFILTGEELSENE
jgi:hypothetical protein